jgi:signal transduction histidine kinase
MVGDRLIQVGSMSWNEYSTDLRKTFFEDMKPGDSTPILVDRNGQLIAIQWTLPGFNAGELWDQLNGQWFFAYFFWLAGLITVLFLRPRDERWWLMVAFGFLTAVWLITGSGPSNYHLWYSALILRVAVWLSVPVYLHLHWVFPQPLRKLPSVIPIIFYITALGLAIAQWFQFLPAYLYFAGFLFAIAGSLILLIIHAIRQAEVRRQLLFMIVVVCYAFLPMIALGIVATMKAPSYNPVWGLAFVSFAAIPFAYLYIIFRRGWGGLEMRANRLVSVYFFLISLGFIGIPIIAYFDRALPSADDTLIVATSTGLIAVIVSLWLFPRFQRFVEAQLLGIETAPEQIRDAYTMRTAQSISINALVDLIKEVMLPSVLVRQFLFVQFEEEQAKVLLDIGTDQNWKDNQTLSKLVALKDISRDEYLNSRPFPWVRLILPLKAGDKIIGLWLFGRRDPDDWYPQSEIPIIQSLAYQTAAVLGNIVQTEHLRLLCDADIMRYEQERLDLAHELHDNILNQMAAALMKDNHPSSANFQNTYNELIQRLREIVSDLRPPTLSDGLKVAIKQLADNLMERSGDAMNIVVNITAEEQRFPEGIERNIYRIVQQACDNTFQHGNAKQIFIAGSLTRHGIELSVQDDGVGFDSQQSFELDNLLTNRHFGLAGMIERGISIGGNVNISSTPATGTCVRIIWNMNHVG